MYKSEYIPIVTFEDINEAMHARYERAVSLSELFENPVSGTYMNFRLDYAAKEIAKMDPSKGMLFTFIHTIMEKDFNIHTPSILIKIP